jgi:hypothetical protein
MRITSGGNIGIGTTTTNIAGYGGARVITLEAQIQPIIELVGSTYNAGDVYGGGAISFRNTSAGVGLIGVENKVGNQGELVFYTNDGSALNKRLVINPSGAATFSSSITTAAPSGGTAKPWKLGQAGVSVGGANTTAVAVEIDGTVYYLLTAYLPEPEPDPAALPASGPSGSYKTYNKPTPVKSAQDAKIQALERELAELKEMVKKLASK